MGCSMRGLRAFDIALRAANLLLRATHGGIRAGELRRQLRDLEDGERLSFLHVIAHVYVNLANVPSDFGMHIDVLKGLELSRNRQRVVETPAFHAGNRSRSFSRGRDRMIRVIGFARRTGRPAPEKKGCPGD
jgi:hypothetical protein